MISMEEYLQNPIKRHIIGLLIKNKNLKYSELMPEDVDNVLFNYHLQHLVKNGLLIKTDNGYSFSEEGWKATSNITTNGMYFAKFVGRYRMYLIHDNKILFHHRKISPWFGDTTALTSKLVYGVGIEERASFRMKEKTNLDVNMKWVGTVRRIVFSPMKDVIDDSLHFICYATDYNGTINADDDNGNPLIWYSFEEAIELEKKNKGSGEKTVEILQRFKQGNFEHFNFEEIITSEPL